MVFDKLKFWKKDDDFGDLEDFSSFGLDEPKKPQDTTSGLGGTGNLGPMPGDDFGAIPGENTQHAEPLPSPSMSLTQPPEGSSGMQQQPFSQQQPQNFSQQPSYQRVQQPEAMTQQTLLKDIEIIHAKLDAIKSSLDSINARLYNLERIAQPERNKNLW